MSKKDKLISVDHLKWNVGGIKCGTLTVDYLNWILDHEEPAVDAVPVRHGRWIKIHPQDIYECSECHQMVKTSDIECYIFCHRCGARMDEEND